jgi:hypothetical protein
MMIHYSLPVARWRLDLPMLAFTYQETFFLALVFFFLFVLLLGEFLYEPFRNGKI